MARYDAFISYNSADSKFAKALEDTLEKYRPPKSIREDNKHLNVFRYEGDMSGVEYHKAIENHLLDSRKLIVLCSPEAKKSTYVKDEIDLFARKNSPSNIITVLVRGIPTNEVEESNKKEDAFPEIIWKLQKMPLAKDFREFNYKKNKLNKGQYLHSWYKLLADILDKSIDEVTEKEIKRKTRNRNQLIGIASFIIVALLVLSSYAFLQKRIAEKKTKEAITSDSIAQIRKAEAEYEANRALDSARVAKEQRKIAQEQSIRANDSAKVAQQQRKIAITEAKRANDSAEVAKQQRIIAEAQTQEAVKQKGIAIENEAETNRINELLLAENLSFQSLDIVDPESRENTVFEAYHKYKDCAYDTSIDASREKSIYEALYKLAGSKSVNTDIEYKYLIWEKEQLLCFGNEIKEDNSASYISVDPELMYKPSSTKLPGIKSTVNYYEFLPGTDYLITFDDDHSLSFWKVYEDQISFLRSFKLGSNQIIREVTYSNLQKTFALAGNKPEILLVNLEGDTSHIDTRFGRITGISFINEKLYAFSQDGYVQEIDPPISNSKKIKISKSAIITTATKKDKIFLGLVDGKILKFDTDEMIIEDSIRYKGNSRVELLYSDPSDNYLIASFADGDVHVYDLRYLIDAYYKPRIIDDLKGKVRSMVVHDNYLYMSLSDRSIVKFDLDMNRLAISLGYLDYLLTKK